MSKKPITSRKMDQLIQVRCNGQFLRHLDEWRRAEPDLPTRAEAIRRIVSERLRKAELAEMEEG